MGKRKVDSELHRIKLDTGTVYQTQKGGTYYFRYQINKERKCVSLKTANQEEAIRKAKEFLPTVKATNLEIIASHVKVARKLAAQYFAVLRGAVAELKEEIVSYRVLLDDERKKLFDEAMIEGATALGAAGMAELQEPEPVKIALGKFTAAIKTCSEAMLKCFADLPAKRQRELLEQLDLGFNRFSSYKKALEARREGLTTAIHERIELTLDEGYWLVAKFRDSVYADIPGLCKIATLAEIEEKNWSLTPGAYVGVAQAEDDGVDFAGRMREIHAELLTLQEESNALMKKISANFKELGI